MERTITVTGKGMLSVAPDTFRLTISLTGLRETYEQSRVLSVECANQIAKSIERIGFGEKDLKTTAFSISAQYNSYQDQNKNWKKSFEGYSFSHRMKLEFPIDNNLLGQVVRELNGCSVQPNIDIDYIIHDPESVKNQLLAKAVSDAKSKAQIMAQAAGVILAEPLTIDYSWGELNIIRHCEIDTCESNRNMVSDYSFTPDDIDLSDTVTIVWSIQ